MHVTDYYGISRPVPFLDVDVDFDRPMFVDPHAIRLNRRSDPYAARAMGCLETFFHTVASCAVSARPADRSRGLDLLQHFMEPWETRLGLSTRDFRGHGGAADVGSWIWQALTTDARALVDVGILSQVEDLPLFVEGVAEDITSDLTTRIVFEPLARFTADMVARYPQLTAGSHATKRVESQVWDNATRRWANALFDLPTARGKELLLIPRNWARPRLLMSAGRFYGKSVLDYAQFEQSTKTRQGKILKPRKDDLREQDALARSRATILKVTLRASAKGENILELFKAFVDNRFTSLDDETVNRKLE